MSQEIRLSRHVKKLDYVLMTDDTAASSLWEGFCRNDLPPVVGVIVRIAGNLLT